MKRCLWLVAVLLAAQAAGCYWMSGPWTGPDLMRDKFKKVEVGSLREDVEDQLGGPSEIMYVAGADGRVPPDSKEAWLLYKYDYPQDPLLITVKVDRFGIVTEKHLDDQVSVAKEAARRPAEEKPSYPGAPQRHFMELIKKKSKGQQQP